MKKIFTFDNDNIIVKKGDYFYVKYRKRFLLFSWFVYYMQYTFHGERVRVKFDTHDQAVDFLKF